MSDAAQPGRCTALEDSAPCDPMKPAAAETGRGGRADVRSSKPAAGMESPDASKAWRSRRADVGSSDRAPGRESPDAGKAWGNGRDDVGKRGAMKPVKIAAAKAAVESSAGKAGG